MIKISHMNIEFEIFTDESNNILNTIVNQPIMSKGVPVGRISDVKVSTTGYKCLGVIWNRFLGLEYNYDIFSDELEVEGIDIL